jgi:hypothetical protein
VVCKLIKCAVREGLIRREEQELEGKDNHLVVSKLTSRDKAVLRKLSYAKLIQRDYRKNLQTTAQNI